MYFILKILTIYLHHHSSFFPSYAGCFSSVDSGALPSSYSYLSRSASFELGSYSSESYSSSESYPPMPPIPGIPPIPSIPPNPNKYNWLYCCYIITLHSRWIKVHILISSLGLFVVFINPFRPIDLKLFILVWEKAYHPTEIMLFLTFSFIILGQYSPYYSFFTRFTIIFRPLVFHLLS